MCLGGIIPRNSRNSETITAAFKTAWNLLILTCLDHFWLSRLDCTRLKYLRLESSVSMWAGSNAQKDTETVQILTMFVGIDLIRFAHLLWVLPMSSFVPPKSFGVPPPKKKLWHQISAVPMSSWAAPREMFGFLLHVILSGLLFSVVQFLEKIEWLKGKANPLTNHKS